MADLKYIGKNILTHDLILKKGDVSGSASSTGSFGNLNISDDASITGNMVVGGRLTAQEIHTVLQLYSQVEAQSLVIHRMIPMNLQVRYLLKVILLLKT